MCGKLNYSMYGTRRAATNWQAHYTKVLVQNGFVTGLANNCTFHHPSQKIYCMVHGDDFSLLNAMSALELMDPKMDSGFGGHVETVDERLDSDD